ncbi:hypothetical protein KFE25_000587 [Diacronema lutheri]|uniref:PSP proline-rich domain-containing protein n=1 Tax=Diacronema lutheri TaxID=2081491 RepID=A0A8J6CDN6_DIALT|nr:hypothetical protein KFE25_000587 [Diacronema lutheri]
MSDDEELFGGFDEPEPKRASSAGLVGQLREENAALRRQLVQLAAARDAGARPAPLKPAFEELREAMCTVTFHPQASLELRCALERVLRSARAVRLPQPVTVAPDNGGEPAADDASPAASAHVAEPALEVHFMQAYCWDAAGAASGWDALQQSTLVYHRPIPLLEGETILFNAHAAGQSHAKGRRGARRAGGGGGGDGRRYWELDLGPDPDEAGAPGSAPAAAPISPPQPGVLSPALATALGMASARYEPPPYLHAMRCQGYPPAYEVARHAAPPDDGDGALLFFDAADGAGSNKRSDDGIAGDRRAPPSDGAAAAGFAAPPAAAAAAQDEHLAASTAAVTAAPDGTQRHSRVAASHVPEEGELSDDENDGDPPSPRPPSPRAPSPTRPARALGAPLAPLPVESRTADAPITQLYAYPGLNAPPPDGADPRAWHCYTQPAAQHSAPGPMRGSATCRPHVLAACPPRGPPPSAHCAGAPCAPHALPSYSLPLPPAYPTWPFPLHPGCGCAPAQPAYDPRGGLSDGYPQPPQQLRQLAAYRAAAHWPY